MSETSNDAVNALLSQYEKNNSPSKSSNTFSLKNYFTTFLPTGIDSMTKTVRILPSKNGGSPLTEVMGHGAEVDGGYRTFMCLKHEKGEACPFCEAREALYATGKEEDKKLAGKYSARKMYIAEVIDRDKEDEGKKFWRFKHDYRKTGTFDKIHGIIKARKEDIWNIETGRDLIISIARDSNKRPQIQSILDSDKSPLSADATKSEQWLADPKGWEDVYAVKTYEYLALIVQGEIPMWDKVNECYAAKSAMEAGETSDNLESELTIGGGDTPVEEATTVESVVKEAVVVETPVAENTSAPASTEDDGDDLPF